MLERVIQQRYTPAALFARGRKSVREALEVVADLPRDLPLPDSVPADHPKVAEAAVA